MMLQEITKSLYRIVKQMITLTMMKIYFTIFVA